MREPESVRSAWRALGGELAALRRASGHTQHSLAPLTTYGRSTIANVEVGTQHADRRFWIRCDEILGSGNRLAAAYDAVVQLDHELRRQDTLG